jgi:hypothetical protein
MEIANVSKILMYVAIGVAVIGILGLVGVALLA